jgi:hypothetical protein
VDDAGFVDLRICAGCTYERADQPNGVQGDLAAELVCERGEDLSGLRRQLNDDDAILTI